MVRRNSCLRGSSRYAARRTSTSQPRSQLTPHGCVSRYLCVIEAFVFLSGALVSLCLTREQVNALLTMDAVPAALDSAELATRSVLWNLLNCLARGRSKCESRSHGWQRTSGGCLLVAAAPRAALYPRL
jgi:hypothetical protein